MTPFLASFAGALLGQVAGGVLVWRYFIKPRMARGASRIANHPRPSRSQPTATTPGFVRHEREVTVQHAQMGRVKKHTRL